MAVRETICRKSVYSHQLIDERLMSMRVELTGESVAINPVVVYAPTHSGEKNIGRHWDAWLNRFQLRIVRTDKRKRVDSKRNGRV